MHSMGRSHISKFGGDTLLDSRFNALFQSEVTKSSSRS
jgi:hypothetical protein